MQNLKFKIENFRPHPTLSLSKERENTKTHLSFFPPLTSGRVGWGFGFVFFFFLFFAFYKSLFAASLFFETKDKTFSVGNNFLVEVFLDAEGQSINAVSGKIVFNDDILEVNELRDGNSSINFWVEKLEMKNLDEISFSGITPGGLSGTKNLLFAIVFKPKQIGDAPIRFNEFQVLQNDGAGSLAKTTAKPFNLSILSGSGSPSPDPISLDDFDPPEDFAPYIASDPEIFDGKYFLVFKAEDKGVGVDHYEVKEGLWGKYVRAESPYLIKDQSLNKKIYVKAVDKSLNERVVAWSGAKWYQQYLLLGIIILLIAILAFALKKLWSRFIK